MKRSATTPPAIQGQQPASNPFPKVVYGGIVSAFGNNIYGIRRASFVANAGTTDQAIISPNGTCSSGLATPTSFILSFGTQQATDSYGLTIAGGPGEPDPGNIFTQNVGPSATSIITGFKTTKGKGGRKLPWVSNLYAGKGIQGGKGSAGVGAPPAYGTFPIPDPKNPGSYIAAPGSGTTADPIVSAPEIAVELLTVGGVDQSYLLFGGDDGNGLGADITKLKTVLGGGGSGGAGAATYAISQNYSNTNRSTFYVPWNTFEYGSNVYLNSSHTDGLTIPSAGDYDVNVQVQYIATSWNANYGPGDSTEWWITLEQWRAGSVIASWQQLGISSVPSPTVGVSTAYNSPTATLNTVVPACQTGDVIKTSLYVSTADGGGFQVANTSEQTYISIAGIGTSGTSTLTAFQARLPTGAFSHTVTTGSGNWVTWLSSNVTDQGGFVAAGTDHTTGKIVVPVAGWYELYAEIQSGSGSNYGTGDNLGPCWLGVQWKNGSDSQSVPFYASSTGTLNEWPVMTIGPILIQLNAGDDVEFYGVNDSVQDLGVNKGILSVKKVG